MGEIGDDEAEVGSDAVALGLGDDGAGTVPGIALVLEAIKQPLLLAGLPVLLNRLVHQCFGEPLEAIIGGEAEGVGEVVFLADLVHPGVAEAGVGADVNDDVGALFAQCVDDTHQVIISAQRSVNRSGTEPGEKDMPGGWLADDQGKVLVLSEVSVEERELLMAVGWVVGGVQIERDRSGEVAAVLL